MEKKLTYKELLDHYWKYFELQSNQRHQTCGLYFTLLVALVGGFVTVAKFHMIWAEYIALLAIILIAVPFGLMVWRTSELRNSARDMINALEEICDTNGLSLLPPKEKNAKRTYTVLLCIQFIAVIVASLSAIIALLIQC